MHRYTVELCVVGENLNPEEVTRALGLALSQVRRKGDRRSEESTWPETMWSLDVLPEDQKEWSSLEDGLAALLKIFVPIRERLQSYPPANKLFIWCGHFTSSFDGGPTLSPALLKSLGDFGVQLVLDTYCESSKE